MLIVEPWGKSRLAKLLFYTKKKKTVHGVFWEENVCLNFFLAGNEVYLHFMDCYFDSEVVCDTHVLSPVTIWLRKSSTCSLNRVKKSQHTVPSFCFVFPWAFLEPSVRTISDCLVFQTQLREEVNVKFLGNAGRVIVNNLSSLIFSSTARTISSFTEDGHPLCSSLWTFSCPSLKSHTSLWTIESLIGTSP